MGDEEYKIIGEISESAAFKHRSEFKKYKVKDIRQLIYLYFLALTAMKKEKQTERFVKQYAHNTSKFGDFVYFRQQGTDLYLMLHSLYGEANNATSKHIRDIDRVPPRYFNTTATKRWLRAFKGQASKQYDNRFLLDAERQLEIKSGDYKNIRRVVTNWDNSSEKNKRVALSRLLYALQTKLPRSELIPKLRNLAKTEGWKTSKGKPSHTKKFLKSLALGAAITGGITAYSLYKASKDPKRKAECFYNPDEPLNEVAVAGSTGAGAIAGIPLPVGSKKKPEVKKRSKNYGNAYYREDYKD